MADDRQILSTTQQQLVDLRALLSVYRSGRLVTGPGVGFRNNCYTISPQQPRGGGRTYVAPQPILARVTGVANDYIVVKRVDTSGAVIGAEFNVAKPWKLRHVVGNYPLISSLVTTDTNTIDVSDGSTDETWEVRPSTYAVNDYIVVSPVGYSGVSVNESDLKFMDLNVDGRAWSKV